MRNSIIWENSANYGNEIYVAYLSWQRPTKMTVSYCNVQGGVAQTYVENNCTLNWQDSNINYDPNFISSGFWMDVNDHNLPVEPNHPNAIWSGGDYHLLADSNCIDAGDNSAVPPGLTTDLDGNPRIVDGNNDGNSVVDMGAYEFPIPPLEVAMKFTPQALNPGSKGRWVKAHLVLPEGFLPEDVNTNEPLWADLMGVRIDANDVNVFVNEDGLIEIEAAFSRRDLCGAETDGSTTDVTVTGRLTSGQYFYGTDTIKIINKTFEYLGVLASHWLEGGCGAPDWCGGVDLDHNSAVDFLDFALFDGCCIEVIRQ